MDSPGDALCMGHDENAGLNLQRRLSFVDEVAAVILDEPLNKVVELGIPESPDQLGPKTLEIAMVNEHEHQGLDGSSVGGGCRSGRSIG